MQRVNASKIVPPGKPRKKSPGWSSFNDEICFWGGKRVALRYGRMCPGSKSDRFTPRKDYKFWESIDPQDQTAKIFGLAGMGMIARSWDWDYDWDWDSVTETGTR